jgi:HD-GYP domain-containing protein (c-di-GMP phosphodiesterase class II)
MIHQAAAQILDRTIALEPAVHERLTELAELFGSPFSLLHASTGDMVLRSEDAPPGDWMWRGELCREIASRGKPEVIEDESPLAVLAIPLAFEGCTAYVAVAGFLTDECSDSARQRLADRFSVPAAEVTEWAERRSPVSADHLLRVAQLAAERDAAVSRATMLAEHVESLSDNLSSTYEEISLLHRLTANLRILEGANHLAELALDWLHGVIPAEGLAAYLYITGKPDELVLDDAQAPTLLTIGEVPIEERTFAEMIDELGVEATRKPVVMNSSVTGQASWRFSSVRELLLVPLASGEKIFGYLAAFNHDSRGEFGTIEASLLHSVATILGIHSGNIELYRDQVKLLTGMVHALVSAIDAKDPYTCGHSDRVARVALRISAELGCSDTMKNTVYLSGLLHDIGKIGICDQILGKEGKLTDEEYEHIKQHPELGYNILQDIEQIKDVLPGVLHHHEAWNGAGYPYGLVGDGIPLLARIIAVADAFDAMGSDRPYRKGMGDEKLDSILRGGAGTQWDSHVVDAFFAAREDIREIAKRERDQINLDLRQWA